MNRRQFLVGCACGAGMVTWNAHTVLGDLMESFKPVCCTAHGPARVASMNLKAAAAAVEMKARRGETQFWEPGSRLEIHFLDGNEVQHARVIKVATEWTEHANLRFIFRPSLSLGSDDG